MDKYKTDICALQEIRSPGKGYAIKKRIMFVDITVTNRNLEEDFLLADLL